MKHFALISLAALMTACGSPDTSVPAKKPAMEIQQYSLDQAGEDYVKIALRMGEVDSDYVDAYSGPKAWLEAIKGSKVNPEALAQEISDLRARIDKLEDADKTRAKNLDKLLRAMTVRLDVVTGKDVSFDKEVSELLNAAPERKNILISPRLKNFAWNLSMIRRGLAIIIIK